MTNDEKPMGRFLPPNVKGQMSIKPLRRFLWARKAEPTGVSGTGYVAVGLVFPDGTTVVRWRGQQRSTVIWDSLEDFQAVNGYPNPITGEPSSWPEFLDHEQENTVPCPGCDHQISMHFFEIVDGPGLWCQTCDTACMRGYVQ